MNRYTLETINSWEKMPHEHVFVDYRKLREDAILNAAKEIVLPKWDFPGVQPKDNKIFWSHVFWWNVVNFAFTHFGGQSRDGNPLQFKTRTIFGKNVAGAYAMAACFYRAFGEKPIFASDIWPHVETLSRMKKFFQGHNAIPMIGERMALLIEACSVLEKKFSGDPRNIWEEGRFRAYGDSQSRLGIVELLKEDFPKTFGCDFNYWTPLGGKSHLDWLVFHFDKRANLAVLMYHDRAEYFPEELTPIADIGELGPCPDYELPRSYAADKIFRYSPELEEKIAQRKLIEPSGRMTLEIRGATVYSQVMELSLSNEERAKRGLPPRHIGNIDYYRWERGRKAEGNHLLWKTTAC